MADRKGKGITVTSGYRDCKRNSSVGGVKKSQHLSGNAADFRITGSPEAKTQLKAFARQTMDQMGLASIGGMPLAVFWLGAQRNDRHKTRANMQTYFGLSTVVSGTILALKGIITLTSALMALPLFAVYGTGLWVGTHAFGVASEQTFRRIAYLTIFLSALVSLPLWDALLQR